MGQIGKNLNDVMRALWNVLGRLFRTFPLFFFVFFGLIGVALYYGADSEFRMIIFLCTLVILVSFIIFLKTQNYAETFLSFLLGVLTIFTINWDHSKSIIFVFAFVGFHFLLFIGSSIQLASKVENILTQASVFIDSKNNKVVYNQLRKISNYPTNFNQLGAVKKAEIIRFLAFIKVPLNSMHSAINSIEMIKTINQIDLDTALNFYRSVYLINNALFKDPGMTNKTTELFLDNISKLPMTPLESLEIFDKTKKVLLSGKVEFNRYYTELIRLINLGLDKDEIVDEIENLIR